MIHISVSSLSLCGRRGFSITLRGIVARVELAAWLFRHFGCSECRQRLEDTLATARPIR